MGETGNKGDLDLKNIVLVFEIAISISIMIISVFLKMLLLESGISR